MAQDTRILQDTNHTGYYGAWFDSWEEEAVQLINDYQTAMAGLNNQLIVGHEMIGANVAVTTYENGSRVYVNYGGEDYAAGQVTVPARSYIVERGEAQ